jgi:t-SNARE complex subunit (syntaxin)
MTTRDLLPLFSIKRNKYLQSVTTSSISIEPQRNFLWKYTTINIDNNFITLQNEITSLENYLKTNILPEIVDNNDRTEIIDNMINKITKSVKFLHKQIEDFNKSTINVPEEKAIIQNMHKSYLKKLALINISFRKNQQYFLNYINKQNKITEDDDIFEYHPPQNDQYLLQVETEREHETSQYLEETKRVLASINELHGLFTDAHLLVDMQGELLDNIEHNIFVASENVQSAHVSLIEAKKNAESATSRKCWILICLVIILLLIIIFFKVSLSILL